MKAVRFHAFDAPPSIDELPEPLPAPGRSIVRMQAATVGHIDRTVWSGRFLQHPPLPYVPGVEGAGIVVQSETFAVGQRVWMRGGGLGIAQDGTWRELVDVPDAVMGALPEGVPMALGSAFFSPCTSAWTALHAVAKVQPGERVLVTGASGAVGSLTMQLATALGAEAAVFDAATRAFDGRGADVLVDTVGGAVLAQALEAVVPGGRAVLVGYTAGNELVVDLARFLQRDVALLPLNMFRRDAFGRAAAPELLARLADGRLTLETREFALHDAEAALHWIATRGHRGRAVLVPSSL